METINEGLEKGVTTGRKERISEIFKISLARGQEVKPRECPKVKVDTSPENPESVNLHLRQVGKDLKSEFGDEAIKATALKRSPSDSESATFIYSLKSRLISTTKESE